MGEKTNKILIVVYNQLLLYNAVYLSHNPQREGIYTKNE